MPTTTPQGVTRHLSALLATILLLAACSTSEPPPPQEDDSTPPPGVTGVVVDSSGEPVQDARVEAIPADAEPDDGSVDAYVRSDETSSEGTFSIEIEQSGRYTIVVHAGSLGAAQTSVEVEVDTRGKSTINITLTVNPIGAIEGQATLQGASDHLGIDVFIPGTSFSARTDTDGSFRLDDVPPGDWTVVMQHDGYARAEQTITLDAGETTTPTPVTLEPIEPLSINEFTATPTSGTTPLDVTFEWDATNPAGSTTTCHLDTNGDGVPEHEGTCDAGTYEHTYEEVGTHHARLRVISDLQRATQTLTITVAPSEEEPTTPTLYAHQRNLNPVPTSVPYLYDRMVTNDDLALVGVPYGTRDDYQGRLEVYERTTSGTWSFTTTIRPEPRTEQFGQQIALSGTTAAITSNLWIDEDTNEAVVHIYERTSGGSWTQQHVLLEGERVTPNSLSIDLTGDVLAIGFRQTFMPGGEYEAGSSVRIFERDAGGANAWGETTPIPAAERSDGRTGFFGAEVDISPDQTLIAIADTMQDDDTGVGTGTYVFLYERPTPSSTWTHIHTLTSDETPSGTSAMLDIENNTLVIAPMASRQITYADLAIYQRNAGGTDSWSEVARPEVAVNTHERLLPYNVLLSTGFANGTLAVGIGPADCQETGSGPDNPVCAGGRVYIFEEAPDNPGTWQTTQVIEEQDHPYGSRFGEYIDLSDTGNTLIIGGHIFEPDTSYTHTEIHERP